MPDMKELARERIPAKSLADFQLEDKSYNPDFNITTRFECFATEIERLSLLGIGSYGFLLSTFAVEKGAPTRYLLIMKSHEYLLAFGVIALAVAAAASIISNFLSTKCLGCQLDIVRMFSRLESDRWSPDEQQTNLSFARSKQHMQKRLLYWNRAALVIATLALSLGIFAIGITFAWVIFTIPVTTQAPWCAL